MLISGRRESADFPTEHYLFFVTHFDLFVVPWFFFTEQSADWVTEKCVVSCDNTSNFNCGSLLQSLTTECIFTCQFEPFLKRWFFKWCKCVLLDKRTSFASLYLPSLYMLKPIYCNIITIATNSYLWDFLLLLLFLLVNQTYTGSYVKKFTLILELYVVYVNTNCPQCMRILTRDLEQRLQAFN